MEEMFCEINSMFKTSTINRETLSLELYSTIQLFVCKKYGVVLRWPTLAWLFSIYCHCHQETSAPFTLLHAEKIPSPPASGFAPYKYRNFWPEEKF
jgi:hypothetical protein